MLKKVLDWERGMRENARAVDSGEKNSYAKFQGDSGMTSEAESKTETRAERKKARFNAKAEKQRKKDKKKYGNLDAELSTVRRAEILEKKIAEAQGLGFKLDNKGDTWASMTSPAGDPIGTGGTVMAMATLGLSLTTAKTRRGRENDKNIAISVRPNGVVAITGGSWMLAGEDYNNVPKV